MGRIHNRIGLSLSRVKHGDQMSTHHHIIVSTYAENSNHPELATVKYHLNETLTFNVNNTKVIIPTINGILLLNVTSEWIHCKVYKGSVVDTK